MLFVVGAGNGVGAHQGLAVHFQADHHEVAAGKTQRRVAGGLEAEQRVVPVVNVGDGLLIERGHVG